MKFKIGFEKSDSEKLFEYWDNIIRKEQWSEGYYLKKFEGKWSEYNGAFSVATSSWAGAALAALEYFDVKGKIVLCPSNTFMATPLSVLKAGGNVEFVDCNKSDLCMSYADLMKKAEIHKPRAVWLVHIGGHIAFEVEKISNYCKERGIVLLEDCAHSHGAKWNGKKPGTWGDAGVYSFYATKTISTGEGGMLVTKNRDLAEFAKKFINYGKFEYSVKGLNFRMNEFTAAIGCVQVDRLEEIVTWKNKYAQKHLDTMYPDRIILPDGMVSGYYKYIVFSPIDKSTGKVYDEPCHRIMNRDIDLPNTEWVARNHWCVPIYYKGNE